MFIFTGEQKLKSVYVK